MEHQEPRLLFFSGGTAVNSICSHIKEFTTNVSYIMTISDNGGSTSEILRVLGGPAIGDIRSRLIRLADESSVEAQAVQKFLMYRLPHNISEAKREWQLIVEGTHSLWIHISEPYKETIRAFLIHFHTEILKRPHSKWKHRNFFFSGARLFFCSLETAIFWFSRISGISPNTCVVPVIHNNNNNSENLTIGVELRDGQKILGQNEISHPRLTPRDHAVPPESLILSPSLTTIVDKEHFGTVPLESSIARVFYLNQDRQEIVPRVNPNVLNKIQDSEAIIYSMGSLYTSIIPSLILKGVGELIASKSVKKILILNGYNDRETTGMEANDFVLAITEALNRGNELSFIPSDFVTHVIYAKDTQIVIDIQKLRSINIEALEVYSEIVQKNQRPHYVAKELAKRIHDIVR